MKSLGVSRSAPRRRPRPSPRYESACPVLAFRVSAVLTITGAAAGSAVAPGVGSLVVALGGAASAAWLNASLRPHMNEIAMALVNVTAEDLFRNKPAIDPI